MKIILLLPLLASCMAAMAQELVPRSAQDACKVYSRTSEPQMYDTVDRSGPAAAHNIKPIAGSPRQYVVGVVDAQACAAISAKDQSYFIHLSPWYRASDFITDAELEPIDHWTTRYYLSIDNRVEFGPVEYSDTWGPRERWLENSQREIDQYRVDKAARHVQLFTRDGRYVDTTNGVVWKMHLAPNGSVQLKDPSGKLLPMYGGVPECTRDASGMAICGHKRESAPEHFIYSAQHGPLPNPVAAFRVLPHRIVITRRPQGIRHPEDGAPLEISARFSDPVRPVIFASGVLFRATAKPNPKAAYRPADFAPKETCVADCAEQLRLQGELERH
ncbi:hypothetical protein [Ideonella sp. BN130291]|uniref:hypothetical protein n=1 Tax=Ideonella sp. BN130291 TaxID=3112940 RepID=UPI002E2575B9|nr:hypothetical protein [Ideonella sp. BN130291]